MVSLYCTAFLFLISIHPAEAWWDEGHMLVSVVAQKYLANKDGLELILKHEWPEFSNFSDLTNAAVWPDHIKCGNKPAPYCKGLVLSDSLHLFDSWHFTGLIYNPSNITLKPFDSLMPFYDIDARTPRDAVSYLVSADDTLRSTKSLWTWNLMLRLAVHIIGDLHQPLHTTSLYSEEFPSGDEGGNLVKIEIDGMPGMNELHALWDAGGGQWKESFPVQAATLDAEVERITAQYPAEYFIKAKRLSQDWATPEAWGGATNASNFFMGLTTDTEEKLIPQVYAEYLKGHSSPYHPSAAYLVLVKTLCDQQVALAGYRLASWLNSLSSHLPESAALLGDKQSPGFNSPPVEWVAVGSGLGGLVMGLVVMFCFLQHKRRRHSAVMEGSTSLVNVT